jgi:hypothetical protein
MAETSANNLRAIWFGCWLWIVAWKLELSSCVELMPRRETDGDEWAMNLKGRRPAAYSPKYVEEVGSCELPLYGVLRSSAHSWCSDVFCAIAHIHSPKTGVCCPRCVAS